MFWKFKDWPGVSPGNLPHWPFVPDQACSKALCSIFHVENPHRAVAGAGGEPSSIEIHLSIVDHVLVPCIHRGLHGHHLWSAKRPKYTFWCRKSGGAGPSHLFDPWEFSNSLFPLVGYCTQLLLSINAQLKIHGCSTEDSWLLNAHYNSFLWAVHVCKLKLPIVSRGCRWRVPLRSLASTSFDQSEAITGLGGPIMVQA